MQNGWTTGGPCAKQTGLGSRDRSPARQVPGPEEADALYFYYETAHGVWRLPVTVDEFPGGLPECTATQAAAIIQQLYPHIFRREQRLILAADRDILRPDELLRRHWQQWREFSVATVADNSRHQDLEEQRFPPGPQGLGLLLPGAQLRRQETIGRIDRLEGGRQETIPHRPTMTQLFGTPPEEVSVAVGLPHPAEIGDGLLEGDRADA